MSLNISGEFTTEPSLHYSRLYSGLLIRLLKCTLWTFSQDFDLISHTTHTVHVLKDFNRNRLLIGNYQKAGV